METPKLGITNLKPVVALSFEAGNVGDKVGRLKGAARYLALMDLFDELMGLAKVDFKMIMAEIKDLDDAETTELHDFIKVKFDIVDDKLEIAIEESIKIAEEMYSLVKRSMALAKSMKA